MRLKTRISYNPHDFKKVPFLSTLDGKIMNGHWDVTDVPDKLKGIVTGEEEIRLKDYLVYRPLPKMLVELANKPDVHPQSYEMSLYYKKIHKAMKEGVYVGAEYYNPMFCFWIIMFIFEIPKYDKKGNLIDGDSEIGRPLYSNIDRYIFDLLWKAFKQRKYGAIMGGRGIGKSFITDSVMAWYYMIFDRQELIISATSEPIVEEAWSKFVDTLKFIESEYPGYHQKRILDSTKYILAGEEYYDDQGNKKERGSLNEVRRIIYGDNANVTRGRRPHMQHIEEFASFPSHPKKGSLKNCIGQSKGSWKVMGSIMKAFVMMTGTGGSVNNKDAEDVFTNPDGFNLLATNEWGKPTGIFIPAFLKYGGTWEGTGCPNIDLAMSLILKSREALESDPVAYTQELQEFPITLEEVFTVQGTNIFNQDKIAEQLTKLKLLTEKPWEEGRLNWQLDKQGNVLGIEFERVPNGKIIVVEKPKIEGDGKVMNNLYVMGVDSIDQGNKDSLVEGSKLAAVVKKRITNNMFSETSNLYACFYNERSDDVRYDYENVLKISYWYNAKVNVEYTKINIVSYFRDKKQFWRMMQRPTIAIGSNISGIKASTLIGTPATSAVIGHQDQKLADYIDDYYYQIMYPPVLEQMRDYSAENRTRFDFVIACGLAELADEDQLGKVASGTGTSASELTEFGFYRDASGKKRWGEIPVNKRKEIKSIAEEDAAEEGPASFRWLDSTGA